jgi:hypothetical protein
MHMTAIRPGFAEDSADQEDVTPQDKRSPPFLTGNILPEKERLFAFHVFPPLWG